MRKLLLLDLDGTIVDTLGFIVECFQQAVAPFVKQIPTAEEIVATFGPAEVECIRRLLTRYQTQGWLHQPLSEEQVNESGRRFHHLYQSGYGAGQVKPYPLMLELIHQVKGAGWLTGIFTGKGRTSALATLDHLALRTQMDVIVTSDDVVHPKPAPEGVQLAARLAGTTPDRTIFVGDNPADILSGREAGARTVAAMWGAFNRAETLNARPDYILETPRELQSLLNGMTETTD